MIDVKKVRDAVINAIDKLNDDDLNENMVCVSCDYTSYGHKNVLRVNFHDKKNVSISILFDENGCEKWLNDENDKFESVDIPLYEAVIEVKRRFLERGVDFEVII